MIRVFVGCAANGEDAESQAVLEYSLRSHSSQPVAIEWMALTRDPSSFWSRWNTDGWSTPFTGFRWGIPAFCNFEGRAIYMDSDMIVRADIAELWKQPMAPGVIALMRQTEGKLRSCVMLMDCDAAREHIPPIEVLRSTRQQNAWMTHYLSERRHLLGTFDGQWNCIDLKRASGIDDPTVKIIHYSSMPHQPHLKHAKKRLARTGRVHWYNGETGPHWHPELELLFDLTLVDAQIAGYTPDRYEPAALYGPYVKKSFRGRALPERA